MTFESPACTCLPILLCKCKWQLPVHAANALYCLNYYPNITHTHIHRQPAGTRFKLLYEMSTHFIYCNTDMVETWTWSTRGHGRHVDMVEMWTWSKCGQGLVMYRVMNKDGTQNNL